MGKIQSYDGKPVFDLLTISMRTIENGLDHRVMMLMVFPRMALLYCLDAPNLFVAPLIVPVVFWIWLCLTFLIRVK